MYGITVHSNLTEQERNLIEQGLGTMFVEWGLSDQVFVTDAAVVNDAVSIINDLGFETDEDGNQDADF